MHAELPITEAVHLMASDSIEGLFGMCVDRFGVQWMLSLPHPA